MSKDSLDKVSVELEKFSLTSIEVFTNPTKHEAPCECCIETVLHHVKKLCKVVKIKNISKKEEAKSEYFRLMFLGDINLKTICIIAEDTPTKTAIMEF